MNVVSTVGALRDMGYEVKLEGADIKLSWHGQGKPDRDRVLPLLEHLKAHKKEAVALLVRGANIAPPLPSPTFEDLNSPALSAGPGRETCRRCGGPGQRYALGQDNSGKWRWGFWCLHCRPYGGGKHWN